MWVPGGAAGGTSSFFSGENDSFSNKDLDLSYCITSVCLFVLLLIRRRIFTSLKIYQWIAKSSLWEPFLAIIHPQIFIEWWLCAKHCSRHCVQLLQMLCNCMDCRPPGASVHGISQARILECVAISSSRGSSQPKDWICIPCIGRWVLYQGSPSFILFIILWFNLQL